MLDENEASVMRFLHTHAQGCGEEFSVGMQAICDGTSLDRLAVEKALSFLKDIGYAGYDGVVEPTEDGPEFMYHGVWRTGQGEAYCRTGEHIMGLRNFMARHGQKFSVSRQGNVIGTLDGLPNHEKGGREYIGFYPGSDVKQGDWVKSEVTNEEFFITETQVDVIHRQPYQIKAFCLTKTEAAEKARSNHAMFDAFDPEPLTVVKKNGEKKEFKGLVAENSVTTDDTHVHFEHRDEIERKLPNGMAEVFEIDDPTFYRGMGGIPDHYQLKVRRKGSRKAGPTTNILNIGSVHGGQIQQGTHHSTQTGTFNLGSDLSDLATLITKVKSDLPKMALSEDQRAEAETYVDAIQRQTKLAKPNPGFIRTSLESLKTVMEGAGGDVVAGVTLAALKVWMNAHGVPL
jgi:hypothetical protein